MHNDTGVTPVQDRISVRRDLPKKVIGLIHVPDGSEEWPQTGVILAVGPRVKDPELVPGLRVLFKPRPASALIWDKREGNNRPEWDRVTQLREEDILGVVEEG